MLPSDSSLGRKHWFHRWWSTESRETLYLLLAAVIMWEAATGKSVLNYLL